MERGGTIELRPWLLPIIVAAIIVPIIAAVILAGPMVGLGAGALVAAAILIIAIRQKPEGPIEVASSTDGRRRVLVVAAEAIDEPDGAQAVAEAAAGPEPDSLAPAPEILVIAPARNRPLAHWLSDLRQARLDAQRRLVLTLGALAAADLDARGEVGDTDPLQAIEDTLRRFPADELVLARPPGPGGDRLAAALLERLSIPVRTVIGEQQGTSVTSSQHSGETSGA